MSLSSLYRKSAELEWDSNFFNLRIASVTVNKSCDELYILNELLSYKEKKADLVYIFIGGDSYLSADVIQKYNCSLVDEKILYVSTVVGNYSMVDNVYEFNGTPNELYDLAFQAGYCSRFRLDSNFTEIEFKKLYRLWVDNSINKSISDKILVYIEREAILGFVTVKFESDKVVIGLIAVDANSRGKKVGSALINSVKFLAREHGLPNIQVSTQKRNLIACSFYEHHFFILDSITNIYHAWLSK